MSALTEGLITAHCVHKRCVGFALMLEPESPRLAMQLLLALDLPDDDRTVHVFYDNACHLQTYVLRREPEFSLKFRFLIDRFHVVDHGSCSTSYHPKEYPWLASNNSMVCEQMHSVLEPHKKSLSGMTQYRAMLCLRLFFYCENVKQGAEMRQVEVDYSAAAAAATK